MSTTHKVGSVAVETFYGSATDSLYVVLAGHESIDVGDIVAGTLDNSPIGAAAWDYTTRNYVGLAALVAGY